MNKDLQRQWLLLDAMGEPLIPSHAVTEWYMDNAKPTLDRLAGERLDPSLFHVVDFECRICGSDHAAYDDGIYTCNGCSVMFTSLSDYNSKQEEENDD